jgi:hypothetical protein
MIAIFMLVEPRSYSIYAAGEGGRSSHLHLKGSVGSGYRRDAGFGVGGAWGWRQIVFSFSLDAQRNRAQNAGIGEAEWRVGASIQQQVRLLRRRNHEASQPTSGHIHHTLLCRRAL